MAEVNAPKPEQTFRFGPALWLIDKLRADIASGRCKARRYVLDAEHIQAYAKSILSCGSERGAGAPGLWVSVDHAYAAKIGANEVLVRPPPIFVSHPKFGMISLPGRDGPPYICIDGNHTLAAAHWHHTPGLPILLLSPGQSRRYTW